MRTLSLPNDAEQHTFARVRAFNKQYSSTFLRLTPPANPADSTAVWRTAACLCAAHKRLSFAIASRINQRGHTRDCAWHCIAHARAAVAVLSGLSVICVVYLCVSATVQSICSDFICSAGSSPTIRVHSVHSSRSLSLQVRMMKHPTRR